MGVYCVQKGILFLELGRPSAVAITSQANRTRVRLEANRDRLSGWVSDRLFGPHPSSMVCIHTSPKVPHQRFFWFGLRTKQGRYEYALKVTFKTSKQ